MRLQNGMVCPVCEAGEIRVTTKDLDFEYKGFRSTFPNRKAFECPVCGESFLDEREERALERSLTDARRRADGLLTSDEIRAIRRRLALTQIGFAKVLGVGEKNFARYESGQATQGRATDNLLRILRERPDTIRVIAARSGVNLKGEIEEWDSFAEYHPYFRQQSFHATYQQQPGTADDYLLPQTTLG